MVSKESGLKIIYGIGLTLGLLCSIAQAHSSSSQKLPKKNVNDKVFMCYYGVWGYYKSEEGNEENTAAKFLPTDIDPFMCTHLIYSFAGLNNVTNKIGSLDPSLDFPPEMCETLETETIPICGLHNMIAETMKLKVVNPNLQILIAIGGWGQESKRFSDMSASPNLRQTFVDSVVEFIKTHGFDGLDMDWEYPTKRGGIPADRDNFVLLLKDLREEFDSVETEIGKKLWLTAALGAGKSTVDDAYDVQGISTYLDYLNIMAYDFKVYVEGEMEYIGHHSPLYFKESENEGNRSLAVSAAVEYFLALGAPPGQVTLGVGAYGKTFTMESPTSFNFYDKVVGPGAKFGFSREPGTIAYNEMCYYMVLADGGLDGWNFAFDSEYYIPFAYNDEMWIGYDDELSIIEKVDYAHRTELGGMMIWSIEQDDFKNWCGGWYPNAIGGTVRERLNYHASNQ